MSTALDTARRAAEKAAVVLQDAAAEHAAEFQAVRERNLERRTAFWTHVHGEVFSVAWQAVQAARTAFTEAVATGDHVAVAYVAYVSAFREHQAVMNATADALATYVNDLTGEPHDDPDARWGRAVYPEGLGKASHAPAPFLTMLDAAVTEAAQAHARTALAELRAPLNAELEPEQ